MSVLVLVLVGGSVAKKMKITDSAARVEDEETLSCDACHGVAWQLASRFK
jgi:hypothetical protein